MLEIDNLHAEIDGKPILKGLSLTVNAGEVHAIMGPNGAGKSTLGYVLGGRPGYAVIKGSVTFNPNPVRPELVEGPSFSSPTPEQKDGASTSSARTGEGVPAPIREGWIDLLALEPHERAAAGLFLGFQYPVEIPGVSNVQFLREALNAQRKSRGEPPLSGAEFLRLARAQAERLAMDQDMLKRPVNVGFSGGEKKRNEMVQMGIIGPKLAILDETDSGLDIDALKVVGDGINRIMRAPDKAVLLITHYQRLLDYVRPDFVHVLADGRITRSGGAELAHELEREGYLGGGGVSDTLELPSRRDEAWRWADLSALPALLDETTGAERPEPRWIGLDGPRLVFVDGVFDAAASAPGRVAIGPVDALTDHPLGRLVTGDGWTLALSADAATNRLEIVHIATGGANHLPGRIELADDAVASVVETFIGTGWSNRLTRIALGRSARLMRSVRLLQDGGFVSLRDEVSVGEGASHVAIVLGAGNADSRIDAHIDCIGDAAFAEMGGALLTRQSQRQEAAVVVRHSRPSGQSRQVWRAVAADLSTASLAARVEVARDAQQTDGEQSLRGLLLRRTATINLKPELEIFADDVKCAHGATVGELDAGALFYLASRGIEPARAKALLTRAFVANALDRIGEDAVRTAFAADAEDWLGSAL